MHPKLTSQQILIIQQSQLNDVEIKKEK